MTGKQLKNSILQWAIQGKLVPQDPNDEPASVLLEKIRAEKARLIKEGKIKKDKKESVIYRGEDNSYYEKILATGEVKCIDEEIPFEVPKSWEWCRLASLCTRFSTGPFGTMVHKTDYVDNGTPLVNPTNIVSNSISDIGICRVSQSKYNELLSYVLQEKDILLARRGDLSKCAIVSEQHEGWLAGTGSFFLHLNGIDEQFFIMVYASPYVQTYLVGDSIGTTMNNLNQGLLSQLLVPIPPYKEQKRIYERYISVLPLTNKYEKQHQDKKTLDVNIYSLLKKSILQEAIQGRLVPQCASDEPVAILLQRIKDEKLRLVKEGKLKKKDVVDSVIFKGDDNKYYEQIDGAALQIEADYTFPDTWEVVRLAHICRLMDGEKKEGNYVCLDAKYLRGKSSGDILPNGKFVSIGDNIILVDGENSGEVFAVPHDGYMGSTFKQLWVSSNMHLPYVLFNIQFYKDLLRNSKKGAAIPHLNKEIFYSLVVGIPPYQEQERIANAIGELYAQL